MKKKNLTFTIILSIFALITVTIAGFFTYGIVKVNQYSKSEINLQILEQSASPTFYDINNIEILSSVKQNINSTNLQQHTINAFLSIEDKDFYNHNGYNIKRIGKAFLSNLKSKSKKEGGSTITQQLAKNAYLTKEKTFDRKLKEFAIARKIESNFSKDEILSAYLNSIYFGKNAYGIESASFKFFGKKAKDLSLGESAYLAAIINAPSHLSSDFKSASQRQHLVLKIMKNDGKITEQQYNSAINQKLIFNESQIESESENYIVATVNEIAIKLNSSIDQIMKSNMKIYTNLDSDKQDMLEKQLKSNVDASIQYSAIIIDVKTNNVRAFVSTQKNAYKIKRSPGSIIKPILVYAPALEANMINENTFISNSQTDFGGYNPKNAGNTYSEKVKVKTALSKSINIPAVRIIEYVGIENAKTFARAYGINFSEKDVSPTIALGGFSEGETLINLSNAYTIFADSGNYSKEHFANKVTDLNGNLIYEQSNLKNNVMHDDTAYLITDMLKESASSGTARRLAGLNFEVASKTGTAGINNSSNNSDAYNISYTTEDVVGVHVFSKNNTESLDKSINGSTLPTMAVKEILNELYINKKPLPFEQPESVSEILIDSEELEDSGKLLLANEFMPERFCEKVLISARFVPKDVSRKFLELNAPELNIQITDDNVILEIDTKPYITTVIYKNGIELKQFNNTSGKQIYIDNLATGAQINYTAKNFVKSTLNETSIESPYSEQKSVYLDSKSISTQELNELENQDTIFESQKPKNTIGNFFKRLFGLS